MHPFDPARRHRIDELAAWRQELRRRRDPPYRLWLVAPLTALALLALGRWAGAW